MYEVDKSGILRGIFSEKYLFAVGDNCLVLQAQALW
jgi:hypothetical protein